MQRNFSIGKIPYRSPKTHLYSLLEIINENEVLCQNEYLVIITAMIIIVFSDLLREGKLQICKKTRGQERVMYFLKFFM